jgi:hypothetical protein
VKYPGHGEVMYQVSRFARWSVSPLAGLAGLASKKQNNVNSMENLYQFITDGTLLSSRPWRVNFTTLRNS